MLIKSGIFIILFCILGLGLFLFSNQKPALPPEVATEERMAVSPSGLYGLQIIRVDEGLVPLGRFQIFSTDNPDHIIYTQSEKYDLRHTTFFVWDGQNRVWVYSGDVGTSIWTEQGDGEWISQLYYNSGLIAPPFLQEIRPKRFAK